MIDGDDEWHHKGRNGAEHNPVDNGLPAGFELTILYFGLLKNDEADEHGKHPGCGARVLRKNSFFG